MMNCPTLLSNGSWALPISVWDIEAITKSAQKCPNPSNIGAKMFISEDDGQTFFEQGRVIMPHEIAIFDEHSIAELEDGTLIMLIRGRDGLYESFSSDIGKTWTPVKKHDTPSPSSRVVLLKL